MGCCGCNGYEGWGGGNCPPPANVWEAVGLCPLFIYDDAGISETQWVPSVDVFGYGTLVGGAGVLTQDWLGSGKPAVNYGLSRVSTSFGGLSVTARTWAFVGEFPAAPGAGVGMLSSEGIPKIFPMFANGASGEIGTDFNNGGSNRILYSGAAGLWGKPFVLTVTARTTNVLFNSYGSHLLCDGLSLPGANGIANPIANLLDSIAIGGWYGAGGDWLAPIAVVGASFEMATAGQLLDLAELYATNYGRANF